MNKLFRIFTLFLLSLAALSSCSKMDADIQPDGTIIISGTISDIDSKQAIESAKLQFKVYEAGSGDEISDSAQNVYTDSKGFFSIEAGGFSSKVKCTITAEAEGYSDETKEVIVNWSGTSYDYASNSFYVNDCDFHLKRK